MGRVSEIESAATECSNYLFQMCKVRTKEQRDCALSRCCGICEKNLSCTGICKYLKDKLDFLNE